MYYLIRNYVNMYLKGRYDYQLSYVYWESNIVLPHPSCMERGTSASVTAW